MPVTPILLPQDAPVRACLVYRAEYDFAVDGGAQGTITIAAGTPIANGSVVVGGYIDVLTQLTGATATIACQIEAANDVLTAVAVASWTTGRKNILPALTSGALTGSTAIKTTADRFPAIVVATANLTAGKFDLVLYVIPPLA